MTQQESTNRRPIETLTAGEHVSDSQGVHEIVHVLGMQDGGAREITLTLRPLGAGKPWLMRHPEGTPVWAATPEEVREYADQGRRLAVAEQLYKLADDIVKQRLPLPNYTLFFSAGVVESRGDLDRWAAYVGGEVRGGTPGDPIPAVTVDRPVAGRLSLNMHAQCQPEPIVVEPSVGAELAAKVQAEVDALRPKVRKLVKQAENADPVVNEALCADPWHEQPTEPTEPCPACNDQPPSKA
ncbi:hypothetical protein [Micromonospora aurantiaca (nom. illeg.)]|uniref:hypothetical protein n=1 Tax=Micromonospora aurantiaca (nom. illeg.) TaxID=47850 RepID=UPI003415642C